MPQSNINATWPDDADGDVFRRLESSGFDFSASYAIDFNVDFGAWPPAKEAIDALTAMYGAVQVFEPEAGDVGYALFQAHGRVSYEAVTSIQRRATSAMEKYGGVCETWGVLHQPCVGA